MDLLQYLILPPSQTPALSLTTAAASASASVHPVAPPTRPPPSTSVDQKICFFYYHMGDCRRDPARVLLAAGDRACPHAHSVPPNAEPGTVEIQQVNPRYHKRACGLPLCVWKNGTPLRQESACVKQGEASSGILAGVGKKRHKSKSKAEVEQILMDTSPKPDVAPESNRNRKGWMYHPDRPSFQAMKRTRVSYDDLYMREPSLSPSPLVNAASSPLREGTKAPESGRRSSATSEKTCFFWYHGSCKRSRDRRGCNMRHALSGPPAVVEPPPGYVHREPCELERCPGDHMKKERRRKERPKGKSQRYFEGSAGEGADLEADTEDDEAKWFLGGFE